MASIFDMDPEGLPPRPKDEEEPRKRGKHRETLSPAEITKGKKRLADMVERAFETLEAATREADFSVAIKAAQIILDRSGFGPKSTVDVNTTTMDLSNLSREDLAERASKISAQLRAKNPSLEVPKTFTTH